jgi:hypothetical protein
MTLDYLAAESRSNRTTDRAPAPDVQATTTPSRTASAAIDGVALARPGTLSVVATASTIRNSIGPPVDLPRIAGRGRLVEIGKRVGRADVADWTHVPAATVP